MVIRAMLCSLTELHVLYYDYLYYILLITYSHNLIITSSEEPPQLLCPIEVCVHSVMSDSSRPHGLCSSVHGIWLPRVLQYCHYLLQGILTQRSEPHIESPALQADSLPTKPPGKPPLFYRYYQRIFPTEMLTNL